MPGDITIDEMGEAAAVAEVKPPDLSAIKLEGDTVPEAFRGKSASDLLEAIKAREEALRISETARKNAETLAELAARSNAPPPQPAPVNQEPPDLSYEDLTKLAQENAGDAIAKAMSQTARKVMAQVDQRLAPLAGGGKAAAESAARQQYPEAFQLFEKDIKDLVMQIPESQRNTVLANPESWKQIVSIVQGKPENLERVIAHRTTAAAEKALAAERERQVAQSANFSGGMRSPVLSGGVEQLDATQQEIARTMKMTPEDYIKWSKAGSDFLQ